jgi:hypothetical protein
MGRLFIWIPPQPAGGCIFHLISYLPLITRCSEVGEYL